MKRILPILLALLSFAASAQTLDVTTKGKIQLFAPDGTLISQHNDPKEAYAKSVGRCPPPGHCVIKFPDQWAVFTPAAAPPPIEPPPPPPPPPIDPPPPPPVEPPPASGNYTGPLVMGQDNAAIATMVRPTPSAPQNDPAYKLQVFSAATAAQVNSNFARNDYSRRQAFNVDETAYLIYANGGSWWLFDTATRTPIMVLPGLAGDCEPIWNPTDPDKLWFHDINGGTTLKELTINRAAKTASAAVVADFAGKLPWTSIAHVWMKSEGGPSQDGRYWVFMAEDSGFNTKGVFTYDLVQDKVLATKAMTSRPDHVSMSLSGKFATISGNTTDAYDVNTLAKTCQLHTTSEHSDLGLLPNGDDYYISLDYQSNGGNVFWRDINTCVRTDLWATYGGTTTSIHFSSKMYRHPGVVVLSTYNKTGTQKWFMEKVMLYNLANGEIANIAHHRSNRNPTSSIPDLGYFSEPHAIPSPSGRFILFNSNWNTGDLGAFLVPLTDAQLAQVL